MPFSGTFMQQMERPGGLGMANSSWFRKVYIPLTKPVQTCNNNDILQVVQKHIQAALSVAKALEDKEYNDPQYQKSITIQRNISPNENQVPSCVFTQQGRRGSLLQTLFQSHQPPRVTQPNMNYYQRNLCFVVDAKKITI